MNHRCYDYAIAGFYIMIGSLHRKTVYRTGGSTSLDYTPLHERMPFVNICAFVICRCWVTLTEFAESIIEPSIIYTCKSWPGTSSLMTVRRNFYLSNVFVILNVLACVYFFDNMCWLLWRCAFVCFLIGNFDLQRFREIYLIFVSCFH